jgi:hypothetical protein
VSALYPRFNQNAELLSALQEFSRFGRCRNLYSGIVDDVSLAPASIEEQDQLVGLFPECEAGAFKTESMMPWNCRDTVSGAGRCHPCHLQGCVVSCCESPVLRERRESGVSQIPLDYCAEFIEFLLARLVRVNLPRGEQSLPTHPESLPALSSYCAELSAESGSSQQPS